MVVSDGGESENYDFNDIQIGCVLSKSIAPFNGNQMAGI